MSTTAPGASERVDEANNIVDSATTVEDADFAQIASDNGDAANGSGTAADQLTNRNELDNEPGNDEVPGLKQFETQRAASETIGLFGARHKNIAAEYHLTRRSKIKRLRQIMRIAMQYDALKGLTPVKLRHMLEALGPTFVKVGQVLSMRSEILPQAFCDELAKLRADADPMPYAVVVDTLETEYGRRLDDVFESVDPTPLGSASLAQVHRARLVTGEDVAVKVQRPGVRETMAEDISLMRSIARGATHIMHNSQVVDLQGVIEELWDTFDEETNFLNEARNLWEFKKFCNQYAYMDCPTPFPELCTEHVLVMEYMTGIPIAHTKELVADGYSLTEIGTKLVDNYASQILDVGFFHADPHPGNIMIHGGQIVLLDLGMTGRLDAPTRAALKQMLFAVAKQDSPGLADALLRFTRSQADSVDYPELLADLDGIVQQFGTVDLVDLDLAQYMGALTSMAHRHGIEMPSSITTVGRALVTLEGLLTEFIPNVNMIQIISEHIASGTGKIQLAKDEMRNVALESHTALHAGLKAVKEAQTALHMLTRGDLRMNFELVGSREPLAAMSDMVNRLTMALIVVGLFVGSSIVYYAGMKPIIFGIPVVGFLGYLAAFVLSVWIVVDIFMKNRARKRARRRK
ncbi:ABC1 kinase family protein [Bifidobacterium gallicum]|uniref:ABC1 family protein n=1 Tax=Bifidobacterium gallicum DSM 20093 = LMG 11596 TaxID=561180 RepID=D1NVZ5_9BIFI|nr:AarF/UbiB family protein [Bifidobacterium gallicum]EFA22281.1 ABC1 family protein [Bifidobacterium gallicum DSM 20093 = LMG 11596]KFI60008.1 protein kinase [Bifidobacterium gallicum DSM 20093 = LMG 11596]